MSKMTEWFVPDMNCPHENTDDSTGSVVCDDCGMVLCANPIDFTVPVRYPTSKMSESVPVLHTQMGWRNEVGVEAVDALYEQCCKGEKKKCFKGGLRGAVLGCCIYFGYQKRGEYKPMADVMEDMKSELSDKVEKRDITKARNLMRKHCGVDDDLECIVKHYAPDKVGEAMEIVKRMDDSGERRWLTMKKISKAAVVLKYVEANYPEVVPKGTITRCLYEMKKVCA